MNVHPLIVHFPIACLVLYSLLEIGTVCFPRRAEKRKNTKLFLLFVGTLGTRAALQSGEVASDLYGGGSRLIETHEDFAEKTYSVYGILSIHYLIWLLLLTDWVQKMVPTAVVTHIQTIITWKYMKYIVALIAIIGMTLLSITGALWWAIAHGPDTDPVARIVYDLFVGK